MSVLCGEGVFSCLCLALHQAHVVTAGTAEGCLLLWDLRGPASTNLAVVRRESSFFFGGWREGSRAWFYRRSINSLGRVCRPSANAGKRQCHTHVQTTAATTTTCTDCHARLVFIDSKRTRMEQTH